MGITAIITQQSPSDWLYHFSLSLSFVLAQGSVLFIFYLMHKGTLTNVVQRQFNQSTEYIWRLFKIVIVVSLLLIVVQWLIHSTSIKLYGAHTQYEQRVLGLFKLPISLLFTFISMVILRPMIEQLIYRHLIIHELGKVWNKTVVVLLSIAIETIVHVYDMFSIFEMVPYLIIACGTTYLYIKTHHNIVIAYLFQVSIQFIFFIETLCKIYVF